MKQLKEKNSGFTLIESILYIALLGTLISAVAIFADLLSKSQIKNQVNSEVSQQAALMINSISYSIRNSSEVLIPTPGQTSSNLGLNFPDSTISPTTFELEGGDLKISEGPYPIVALNNSQISVSDLQFQNLSSSPDTDTIRFSFTLTYNSESSGNEYNYSQTYVSAVNLKQ